MVTMDFSRDLLRDKPDISIDIVKDFVNDKNIRIGVDCLDLLFDETQAHQIMNQLAKVFDMKLVSKEEEK